MTGNTIRAVAPAREPERTQLLSAANEYDSGDLESAHNVVVDAMWGFAWKGEPIPDGVSEVASMLQKERILKYGAVGRLYDLTPPPLRRI